DAGHAEPGEEPTMKPIDALTLTVAVLLCGGCLSQNAPATPRYFHPATPAPAASANAAPAGDALKVRLGRVSAAPYLGDRMVVRVSDVEIGFDELHRWAAT